MEANTNLIFFLLIYFLVLAVLLIFKPNYVPDRKLYLFRVLFPSWKFFEDICYLPQLYYRTSNDGKEFEPWQEAFGKLERSWRNFFINPQGNLFHACNSLLQQLENDKEEVTEENKEELLKAVSYLLTKNLVALKIGFNSSEDKKIYFQFKLRSTKQGSPEDAEDILISAVHKVGKAG